jgi:hypothetical protein
MKLCDRQRRIRVECRLYRYSVPMASCATMTSSLIYEIAMWSQENWQMDSSTLTITTFEKPFISREGYMKS